MKKVSLNENGFRLGIDVGSVSVKLVLIDTSHNILYNRYIRHKGHPGEVLLFLLKDLDNEYPVVNIAGIGVTGSGGKRIASILKVDFINEVIADSKAIGELIPDVRAIINIGGQDAKLIFIEKKESPGYLYLDNFSMNTLCAAGTGAFLDQQARRLGISIENEFGELALKSKNPPRIAGRCSVFAKTDIIHLQQQATPSYDIVAGLCYAMARNFKATIVKNQILKRKVAFIGGVALNKGMIQAFRDTLDLKDGDLVIPENNTVLGAIGAAMSAKKQNINLKDFIGFERELKESAYVEDPYPPLLLRDTHINKISHIIVNKDKKSKIPAFLGIDVGSISTNLVIIDDNGSILVKRYLKTGSNPIEVVRKTIKEVGSKIEERVVINGACVTGSGRYLIGDFIGADMVKNEITAHARGAFEYNPEVDTIFEIGGQDSKYISLDNGVIIDFEMNKVCAAGTGSFLEEQAERLGINLHKHFSCLALNSKSPCRCGERCTVFMESDLIHHQQRGSSREDIVAGLCYSIVYNYMNKVVENRRVGDVIFFQGGVAFNKGVIAAFEKIIGKQIIIPPHHEVIGAYGAALLVRDNYNGNKSRFKSFSLYKKGYDVISFECKGCANVCKINKITLDGQEHFFYGSRCEKYDRDKKKKEKRIRDLFHEREKILFTIYNKEISEGAALGKVGIPLSMIAYENLPFWKAFFTEIGLMIELSKTTNKNHIYNGLEAVIDEPCFPIKVLHGHVLELLNQNINYIFLPHTVENAEDIMHKEESFFCPYIQAVPDIIRTSIDVDSRGIKVLEPSLKFSLGLDFIISELYNKIGKILGIRKSKVIKALKIALDIQTRFYKKIRDKGKEYISSLKDNEIAIILVGRPYNTCDRGINLDIPKKIMDYGVKVIPMDYLPLSSKDVINELPNMTWWYGQRILSALEYIRKDKRLFPVYVTNFACGPDSFILQYFRYMLPEKPYLQIEIDEHSADTGLLTRIEAYIDSITSARLKVCKKVHLPKTTCNKIIERTIYIPAMCDHAHAVVAAFRAHGVNSEVLPMATRESIKLGRRYTTGKECYPYLIIISEILEKVFSGDFVPEKSAFLIPSSTGVCRLNHYNTWQRIILKELGINDVIIFSPDMDDDLNSQLDIINTGYYLDLWKGIVAIDILFKALRETKPYEINKGQTQRLYNKLIREICYAIEKHQSVIHVLKQARKEFEMIPVDKGVRKPVIGVIGELFIRNHAFSNNFLIDQIEELGGEVWSLAMTELFYYINTLYLLYSKWNKNFTGFFSAFIKDTIQKVYDYFYTNTFKGFVKNLHEPTTAELFNLSLPYFDPVAETETPLNLGKTLLFLSEGANGIINTMPFTCMPGTITASILNRIKSEKKEMAYLTIKYDGTCDVNMRTRLEAFMHQASQYIQ